MRTKLIVIGSAAAAILLLGVFILLPPSGVAASPLAVTFAGYTNDNTGERVAKFTISNRSGLSIKRESHCDVEYKTDPHLLPSFHVGMPVVLDPGHSEDVRVPAPRNHGPWRVGFKVLRIDTRFKIADGARSRSLLPEQLYTRLYNARIKWMWSEWIDE